jgi:hypothetical protein
VARGCNPRRRCYRQLGEKTLRRLAESVERLQERWRQFPELGERPGDAGSVIRLIWPDTNLSFKAGAALAGVATKPLAHVVTELFQRMVTSQGRTMSAPKN